MLQWARKGGINLQTQCERGRIQTKQVGRISVTNSIGNPLKGDSSYIITMLQHSIESTRIITYFQSFTQYF